MTDQSANPLITVFVLNWNRKDDLVAALESVRRQTYQPIEMLVVDNGSTDDSVVAVKDQFPEAKLVCLDKNYGCPGGRNRGIPHATGEFIFFLDNDGLLKEDAVEEAYALMLEDDRLGVVSGKTVYYKTGEDRFLFRHGTDHINDSFYVPVFSGGASMHRSSVYAEVGVYPDDYMYGGEEADLSFRLLDRGYRIRYAPQVVMYHKMSSSTRSREREYLYKCSNTLCTAWRLYPVSLAVLYTIRSFLVQPLSAARSGYLKGWIRATPSRIARAVRSMLSRDHVISWKTLATVERLHSRVITSPEQVFSGGEEGRWSTVRLLVARTSRGEAQQ